MTPISLYSKNTAKMPAINKGINLPNTHSGDVKRSVALIAKRTGSQLAKRNWASQEAGVIVVFCIVFVVAVGLIALFIHKKLLARKAAKQTF